MNIMPLWHVYCIPTYLKSKKLDQNYISTVMFEQYVQQLQFPVILKQK